MPAKEPTAPTKPRNMLNVVCAPGEKLDDVTARELTRPEVQAASVIKQYGGENYEINALVQELTSQVDAVNRGDMGRVGGMLVAQAHTLDELFNTLARRSYLNMNGGYLDAAERYLRLALKAQSQCRATLETLAEVKNPRPVAFVKQANIANGLQQVNNGMPAPRAQKNETEQSKLSEVSHELLPNARASGSECGTLPISSALGKIDRAEVHRG